MNIALVNAEYPTRSGVDHGGIATYTYVMANALARMGHGVFVLAKEGTIPDPLDSGVRFATFRSRPPRGLCRRLRDRFSYGEVAWQRGYSRGAYQLVRALHAEHRLDVVESPEYNGLASRFRNDMGPALVIHLHTPTYLIDCYNRTSPSRRRRAWYTLERQGIRRGRLYVSPSMAVKREAERRYGIAGEKVELIRLPLDIGSFTASSATGTPPGDRVDILFTGRLECRKGAELLVKCTRRILALRPDVHFTIAGETSSGSSLEYRRAIERTLTDEQRGRMWFPGPINRVSLPALYGRSDIFLLPSLFDNSPYSLLEAMAAALPVVSTDTGGINELVEHTRTGMLFGPSDPDGLLRCLGELVENREEAKAMGRRAAEAVRKRHDPRYIAERTIRAFERARPEAEKLRRGGG